MPSWAKDPKIGSRMINARSETITAKPAFKAAAARRRCVPPAEGYLEWLKGEDGKKIPYFLNGDGPIAMAGLYELWPNPELPEDDPGRWLWTCTVLTRPATDAAGQIRANRRAGREAAAPVAHLPRRGPISGDRAGRGGRGDADGVRLRVPTWVPPGGRSASLLAHSYRAQLVGLEARQNTGWLEVTGAEARYAPHTEFGFRAPANKTIVLLANGFLARRGLAKARKQGRVQALG